VERTPDILKRIQDSAQAQIADGQGKQKADEQQRHMPPLGLVGRMVEDDEPGRRVR
jgi:hypothetical protein